MAIISSIKTGAAFAVTLGATDKLAFSDSDAAFESYLRDTWNPYTITVEDDLTFIAAGTNNKYISPSQIDIGAGTVTLNTTNVSVADVTLKISWQDDAFSTALSNIRFYAYDGTTPATAPANMTVCAFERGVATINKDRIGGDTAGKAWDTAYGVGGSANALALEDQASAATHVFYVGVSVKPSTYGVKTALAWCLDFDVE